MPAFFDHVSFRVFMGMLDLAGAFLELPFIGWERMERTADWGYGQSIFYQNPGGGTVIQLTQDDSGYVEKPIDAFHIALVVGSVSDALDEIHAFAQKHKLLLLDDDVGDGKRIIILDGLFHGAFELLPLEEALHTPGGQMRRK